MPSECGNGFSKSFLQKALIVYLLAAMTQKCTFLCLCIYIYIYTHTQQQQQQQQQHTHVDVDWSCIWKNYVGYTRRCISTRIQNATFQQRHYNILQFLYCTVTAEKAAKHIVTSIIKKWPHREILNASSSCCVNLWIKGKSAEKMLLL